MKNSQGFTLIELMMTIAIIAVLAAIGYSSYTRYIVRNAEAQVEAKMQSLTLELDRFRASRLTYRGFVPKKVASNGTESYAYDSDGTNINVSERANKYVITLVGGLPSTSLADATGNQWHMFAVPSSTAPSGVKYKYYMSNTGHRCRSTNNDFTMPAAGTDLTEFCSKAGVETW